VVEGKLIVELKCVDRFANEHLAQMHQLPEGLRSSRGPAAEFPKAQGGMEARPF
jgi:hypothetical protein